MQVDLLIAETQRDTARAECHRSHAKDAFVKADGRLDRLYGQNQMVQSLDFHGAKFLFFVKHIEF
jgi:hypothetical protein